MTRVSLSSPYRVSGSSPHAASGQKLPLYRTEGLKVGLSVVTVRSMKLKTIAGLVLLALPVSAFAASEDCAKFAGNFIATDVYTVISNIQISWDSSQLVLNYNHGTENGYSVAFVADGVEHQGTDPANTGKTYTASCSADGISIVRNGLFADPYTTQLALDNNGVLTMTDTIESTPPRVEHFKKTQ
jgi:hypothetical protein